MKSSRRISSCIGMFAIYLTIVLPSAHAQTRQLNEVFVTANRIGQSVDSISSEIDTLDKNELQTMGNANLSQALAKLPGFQTTAYGQHSVYLRGTDSRMTSLYVEGIRIESHDTAGNRLGGGVPWEMLPLEMVDHMEVVRGPSSSIHGSDAMGGAVQLFTKTGAVDDKPQLTQSFGSYGFRQTTGQLSGRKQAFDYSIQLSTNASNGYDTRPDITHTPNKEGSAKHFGMLKLGYDLNAINRVELVRFKTKQSFKSAPSNSGDNDITNHNNITGTKLEWQSDWDANNLSRLRYTQSVLAADSNDPNSGNDVPWNYKTTLNTVSLDHELNSPVGKINGLIERKQDAFKADENYWGTDLSNTAVDKNRFQNALGLGYSLKHAEHLVNAAVRADNYSSFGTHSSYSLSYGYMFQPEWTVMAIQATGFRAPTLEQLYGIYGMTTLAPESNISRELALQFRRGKSNARLSFFENTITDLISANETSTSCTYGSFCYYNVTKVKIQGISLSGKTQVSDVNLKSSVDLLNPFYESGKYAGNQLSLRSKKAMNFSADKQFNITRAGVELQHIGKRFDDGENKVKLPSYSLVNLWSKTVLQSEWSWVNRIDNLFNRKYQQYGCTYSGVDTCSYAMPGTTFFTAVQWQPK